MASDNDKTECSRNATGAQGARRFDETVVTVARIHGRVQGVGYRYWTATTAEHLRLRGYVRNLTDGTVEAMLIGAPNDVARMLSLCEEGPDAAAVEQIVTGPPPQETPLIFERFRRLKTAEPGAPI